MTEAVIEKRNNLWLIVSRYFLEKPTRVKEENQNYFVYLFVGPAAENLQKKVRIKRGF